ncbi:MAG: hypothetical protein WCT31_02610, partial [Candidatus Micrarchaeia archaeon]
NKIDLIIAGTVVERVLNQYMRLNVAAKGMINEQLIPLLFHDQILDQIIKAELMKRMFEPPFSDDALLVKCLVSPNPIYSMLISLLQHTKPNELMAKLGISHPIELILAPEEAGESARTMQRHMQTRNELILRVVQERVSVFLIEHGFNLVEELMSNERERIVRREIFGN